jgi:O-antigen ligase
MVIAFIRDKSRRFTWHPIFYVLCIIYLINVAGLLYTGDFKLGIRRLDTIIVLVVFPVVFSMVQFPKRNVTLILRFFVWSVIAFCTFGLLSYAAIVPGLTWDMIFADSKLYAPLLMMWPAHWHPSFNSMILLMAVPVALYLRYQDKKQVTFVEMLLGVLLPIVFTVLAGARVGMIAVPVLLGLAYLFYCKLKPVFKWGLVAAGIVAVGLLLYQFPETDDRLADPIRSDLRKIAMSAIREKPVFGWGTGYVSPLIRSGERAHDLGMETPYLLDQFHNQYLEDVVQFGIPGIIILITLFGWMLWIGIREKNCLLLSLLAIYMLFCWTETALHVSKGVVTFIFWFCFIIANRKALGAKRE